MAGQRKPRRTRITEPSGPAPERLNAAEAVEIAQGLATGLERIGGIANVEVLLGTLKDCREFATLAALGSTLGKQGVVLSARSTRLTAQSLIELGRFEEADVLLEWVISRTQDEFEILEARGLRGRLLKQRYVNDAFRGRRDAGTLRAAVHEYLAAFEEHPDRPHWHGINAVALLARAARDGITGLPIERRKAIAGEIRERLVASESQHNSYWEAATIAEASLVLEELDVAELWFHRAAWLPGVPAFCFASTARQLREVWQLDPSTSTGARILPPIDARLLQSGHTLLVTPTKAAASDENTALEKVFGTSPYMPFEAWAAAMDCAKSVCRIETRLNQGFGTGFVVNGRLVSAKLPNEPVLITNAHVLSPKGDGNSLTAPQAHAVFYASTDKAGKPHQSAIKKILWSSPPGKFDATIATLAKPPAPKSPLKIASSLPAIAGGPKVYVIGHPGGGGLMFSLNDNELLDHGDPQDFRVHYRTPTEPGSSGSPVFDAQWELIALHHAGGAAMQRIHGNGTYQANEGIAFRHIGPAIRS